MEHFYVKFVLRADSNFHDNNLLAVVKIQWKDIFHPWKVPPNEEGEAEKPKPDEMEFWSSCFASFRQNYGEHLKSGGKVQVSPV